MFDLLLLILLVPCALASVSIMLHLGDIKLLARRIARHLDGTE